MKDIGSKIAKLRKDKSLTQKELAAKLHISGQLISKWENNQATPALEYTVDLCNFFGISIDELVDSSTKENDVKSKKSVSGLRSSENWFRKNKRPLILSSIIAGAVLLLTLIILLTVFVFVPYANKDKYLMAMSKSIANRLDRDEYFNIELVGESDGREVSKEKIEGYLDNGSVYFRNDDTTIVDSVEYKANRVYKSQFRKSVSNIKDLYVVMLEDDDNDFSVEKEDFRYIRKTAYGYYIELADEAFTRDMGANTRDKIILKSKFVFRFYLEDDFVEKIEAEIRIKEKESGDKYNIKSSLLFKDTKPEITISEDRRWGVYPDDTNLDFLSMYYGDNTTTKIEGISDDTRSTLYTALQTGYYYEYNDKLWLYKNSKIKSFRLDTFEPVDTISLDYVMKDDFAGYDNKIICYNNDYIMEVNLDNLSISTIHTAANDLGLIYAGGKNIVFRESSGISSTLFAYDSNYIFYDVSTGNKVVSETIYVDGNHYIVDSYLYISESRVFSDTFYRFNLITGVRETIGETEEDVYRIIFVSSNGDVYYQNISYSGGSSSHCIMRVGSDFVYKYGYSMKEDGEFIYIYDDSYEYKYSGESLVSSSVFVADNGNIYFDYISLIDISDTVDVRAYVANEDYIVAHISQYYSYEDPSGERFSYYFLYGLDDLTKPIMTTAVPYLRNKFIEVELSDKKMVMFGNEIYLIS